MRSSSSSECNFSAPTRRQSFQPQKLQIFQVKWKYTYILKCYIKKKKAFVFSFQSTYLSKQQFPSKKSIFTSKTFAQTKTNHRVSSPLSLHLQVYYHSQSVSPSPQGRKKQESTSGTQRELTFCWEFTQKLHGKEKERDYLISVALTMFR